MGVGILYLRSSRSTDCNLILFAIFKTFSRIKLWTFSKRIGFAEIFGQNGLEIRWEKSMLAWFVKYLPSARMDCIIPWFTVSCRRCAVSCDLLRFDSLSSDFVKYKGAPCVQGIEYAAQNPQKRKKPCAAFNTQYRAFLCCRFLIAFAPLLFLSCFMQGCRYPSYWKKCCGMIERLYKRK